MIGVICFRFFVNIFFLLNDKIIIYIFHMQKKRNEIQITCRYFVCAAT